MRAHLLAATCVVVVVVAVALALPGSSHAETLRLRPDGLGDAPSIQDAIDIAGEWTVIELDDGVYTGPGNRNINFRGKNIVLRSRSEDPTACIIDAEGTYDDPARVMLLLSNEPATTRIEYLTIRGGYLRDEGGWQNQIGAGIKIHLADPTIRGCIITGNTSPAGGALMCYFDRSRIIACEVTDNIGVGISGHVGNTFITSTTVSGNSWHGIVNLHSNMTITNSTITGNTLRGVWTQEVSRSDLTGCTITNNLAGGLAWVIDSIGKLDGCLVAGNAASTNGAGVYMSDSSISIIGTRIVGNRVEGDGEESGSGGGLYVSASDVEFVSTTIAGNHAVRGGGLWARGNVTLNMATTLIGANCATTGADAWVSGGGCRTFATCSAFDDGSIVTDDGAVFIAMDGLHAEADCFCEPPDCASSPTDDVAVGVVESSPCASETSCGEVIGAGDVSCLETPVLRSSWGGVKSRYAPEADDN